MIVRTDPCGRERSLWFAMGSDNGNCGRDSVVLSYRRGRGHHILISLTLKGVELKRAFVDARSCWVRVSVVV